MSFVFKKAGSTTSWPVSFYIPENGTRKEQSFDAEFKQLPQTRINELQASVQKRIKALQDGEEDFSGVTDISIAEEVLVGWSDVKDEEGNDVPFTNKTRKQILEVPMLASAIIEAYFESLIEAKSKN
tara:strand:+ start:31 stop:411 length:381 start_codon:yes stop_codon:yes gene_type:complete